MNFTSKSLANTLKDAGCQLFLNTLDKIDGAKDLVLSRNILVQLDSICSMQKLRQNAVDKVFKLNSSPIISETRNRVYVVKPTVEEVRAVANEINTYLDQDNDTVGPIDIKFWIIFVPRFFHFCDLTLEEEGVYEYVSILECPLGLIPIEYDVYTLEDENIFSSLYLHKDTTPLADIVSSLFQLQLLSGNILDVHGQGRFAKVVADKLDQANLIYAQAPSNANQDVPSIRKDFVNLRLTESKPTPKPKSPFTDLYLIDRDCDYASVLLSQLNYEGILDESFSLCCNKLEFSTTTPNSEEKTPVKHMLTTEQDPIFRDIRDNHFSTVFSLLKTKNYEMKEKYIKSQDMNLSNLKNFVAHELRHLQTEFKCLALHISACEEIMRERNKYDFGDQLRMEQNIMDGQEVKKCLDYITKMIAHQLNPHVPLRLLALLSMTLGGLPPKDYTRFHSLYCENYGLFNNVTFENLKKIGLITEMSLSLSSLTGGLLSGSSTSAPAPAKVSQMSSSLSLSSFTGAMSSLTERASGRITAVVSSSVLPRRGNLSAMLKKFELVPEVGDAGYNIREPKDPAFVFGGAYIPLICQLLDKTVLTASQHVSGASKHKKNTQLNMTPSELAKLLPGINFKRKQAFLDEPPPPSAHNQHENSTNSQRQTSTSDEKCILVFFIGGVTFAEITALRFLAKQRKIKIAIATTSIINGNKLIECTFPNDRIVKKS